MWLFFAIATVLLWGTSETIFKGVSNNEKHSVLKLIAYNGIILGVVALAFTLITKTSINITDILSYMPISLVFITSMFMAYLAMRYTFIGIISPIQNSSCALTTVLCVFVLKQTMTPIQIIGVVGVICAIAILTYLKPKEKSTEQKKYIIGILFALVYFLLDGVGSFLDDYMLESSMTAEQLMISFSTIYFIVGVISYVVLRCMKVKNIFNFKEDKKKLIGTLIETAGQYTYVYTFEYGDAAIASPFIAGYSIVSLILARIFLKEKLETKQYLAIFVMIASLVLLSI